MRHQHSIRILVADCCAATAWKIVFVCIVLDANMTFNNTVLKKNNKCRRQNAIDYHRGIFMQAKRQEYFATKWLNARCNMVDCRAIVRMFRHVSHFLHFVQSQVLVTRLKHIKINEAISNCVLRLMHKQQ